MAFLTMKQEAVIIQRVCQHLKLPGEVMLPPVSFETSRIRVYYIDGLRGFKPAQILKPIKDLVEEELTWAWNRGSIQVRVLPRPLRIEVPRPIESITYLPLWPEMQRIRGQGNGQPLILLGETHDFDRIPDPGQQRVSDTVVVNLGNPSTPHVLLASATGGGKSRLLKGIILSMAAASSPKDVRMIIFDPKGNDFRGFSLPHMAAPIVRDPQVAVETLRAIVAEMERRSKLAGSLPEDYTDEQVNAALGPYIVVFIDELFDLIQNGGAEIEAMIMRLLPKARALKINLFLATQRPTTDTIKAVGEMKSHLTVRIIGTVAEAEHAKAITGLAGSTVQANTLTVGDFILVINDRLRRFHALGLDNDEVPKIVAALWKTWSKVASGWMLNLETGKRAKPKTVAVEPMVTETVALGRDEITQRHESLVESIKARKETQGTYPTANQVRTYHKKQYGTELNGKTAVALLERAKASEPSKVVRY